MIGGDCHLVKLLWLHPYDRLQVTVVWIGLVLGVTLGPNSKLSVWVLVTQCWGDNTRTRLMTSVSKDSPWKSPGGRPMSRMTGGWGPGI